LIPFVREFDFDYGRADAVSPLIRRVVARNPGPFTFTGTGTYIVGHGEVAVIDPGPDDPAHLQALLEALDGERVSHILVTHGHLDHWPLAGPLKQVVGAPIFGRGATGAHAPFEGEADHPASAFRPDMELEEGQRIGGLGWTLETVFTPGHASDHVAFALAEENALFSADHVMGWSTTVVSPPDGDMGDYLASLDKVRARSFDTLWPTHGPPVTDADPFLAAYKQHRLDREAQILEQLRAGAAASPSGPHPLRRGGPAPVARGGAVSPGPPHAPRRHRARDGRRLARGGSDLSDCLRRCRAPARRATPPASRRCGLAARRRAPAPPGVRCQGANP
jgi:glyoxylase-like metal-dependent hydrolase (beta-lactamase superfamily II)